MKHEGWFKTTAGTYNKFVGNFALMVTPRSDGRYDWSVDLPGDQGDRDVAVPTLQEAIVESEGALDLIVSELFDDIAMHV